MTDLTRQNCREIFQPIKPAGAFVFERLKLSVSHARTCQTILASVEEGLGMDFAE